MKKKKQHIEKGDLRKYTKRPWTVYIERWKRLKLLGKWKDRGQKWKEKPVIKAHRPEALKGYYLSL